MILAGDVGGTKVHLALYNFANGRLQTVRDQKFPAHEFANLDDVVNAVKAWLSIRKNAHWLVIYDNYDNPKIPGNADRSAVDVRRFLPGSDHGSIIITTRSSQVTIGRRIQVQKLLNVREGLEILSNTSGRKGVMDGMLCAIYRYKLRGH